MQQQQMQIPNPEKCKPESQNKQIILHKITIPTHCTGTNSLKISFKKWIKI